METKNRLDETTRKEISMSAPINVKYGDPTVSVPNWESERREWIALNEDAGGDSGFKPLTIKGAYVIGVIHAISESVDYLLQDKLNIEKAKKNYLPAYVLFSSSIDLLGRCIKGGSDPKHGGIYTGFKWLANPNYQSVDDSYILVQTNTQQHSIRNLVDLRNFAAHGQATSPGMVQSPQIDYDILERIKPTFAKRLADYWNALVNGNNAEEICNNLAKANVVRFRSWPIFQSWKEFERDEFGEYHGIEDIFLKLDWTFHWR
jgi:hypothetical protein